MTNIRRYFCLAIAFIIFFLLTSCGIVFPEISPYKELNNTTIARTQFTKPTATTVVNLSTASAISKFDDIQLFNTDVTNDGIEEQLLLRQTDAGVYLLKVINVSGELIWSEAAGVPHAGWNSLYLCTIEGKNYILRYNPYMSTGTATYKYELFSIDLHGNKQIKASSNVIFDLKFEKEDLFNVNKIIAFVDEVNSYLDRSYILLSTENGSVVYSTKLNKITKKETMEWLKSSGNFKYDESNTLNVNLEKFAEYRNSNLK